jgi:hypothetical protein
VYRPSSNKRFDRMKIQIPLLVIPLWISGTFAFSVPCPCPNAVATTANGLASTRCRSSKNIQSSFIALKATNGKDGSVSAQGDSAIQWELFHKHHLGDWKGIWTTYDYIGDVQDETVASVDMQATGGDKDDPTSTIVQTHNVVVGAKRSDCATCFDSMEIKSIPVASYKANDLRKARLAACSMINGPSLLRSGTMATELVLRHGDGRVRVVFQHAPVWAKDVEPGSCPPQGLKLFRAMVSREAQRATAPTAESEAANPPVEGNPVFYRPVPPFHWHKKWSGSSWTWGPQSGNRGWMMDEMEEVDAWHGSAPVECWNLRLPGGVFIQGPRIVTDANTELFRLAWLPDDETLLRVEAGVLALQPMLVEDDMMVGFEPPSLASLRCDVLKKVGDLEGEPMFARITDYKQDGTVATDGSNASLNEDDDNSMGLQAIRDALAP